jgi:hypothetical protein
MTANIVEKFGRVPWSPVKAEPPKATCYGDLRREHLLATQTLPDVGKMLAPSHEHALTETWTARKARRARERGGEIVVVEPPPKRSRKPMSAEHKAAIRRGVARARLRAAGKVVGKRPAGRPLGSGSSRRANMRLRRGGKRPILAGSRVKSRGRSRRSRPSSGARHA